MLKSVREIVSERVLFGLLIIGGYFAVGGIAIGFGNSLDSQRLQLTRDVLLTIGPLLGVIVNSIWRTDQTDKQNANTAAVLAEKSPNYSATTAVVPDPAATVAIFPPNSEAAGNAPTDLSTPAADPATPPLAE